MRPVEQGEGDSVVVAFSHATEALACALALHRGFRAARWPAGFELPVRVALHSGEALLRGAGTMSGRRLIVARVWGGRPRRADALSRATYELVAERCGGASLTPLGPQRLRDLARAEEVFELCHPDLPSGFPAPRSLDVVANNLPVELSSFVGREAEFAEMGRLVPTSACDADRGRWVRQDALGVAGGRRAAGRFPDGVWWVDLAPLADERWSARRSPRRWGCARCRADRAAGRCAHIWPPAGRCWSWTTASTCSTPAPSWPRRSWRLPRRAGPGHQPRAAGRGRRDGLAGARRWRCPTGRATGRGAARSRTRCGCSSSGRGAAGPASR